MRRFLLFVLLLLCACSSPFRTQVAFDRQLAQEMPHEKAVDVVTGFTAATAYEDVSNCDLSSDGVMNKSTQLRIPYQGTCFTVRHTSNEFYYTKIYAVIIDDQGLDYCKIQVTDDAFGQENFDRMFTRFGTALIALGSEYCPDK